MACENCDERSVTRSLNRALRLVNRRLRRNVEHLKESTDEVFLALCNTDVEAGNAMGELWGSAAFDCGPQDYDFMVTRSIEAVRRLNEIEAHTNSQNKPAEREISDYADIDGC